MRNLISLMVMVVVAGLAPACGDDDGDDDAPQPDSAPPGADAADDVDAGDGPDAAPSADAAPGTISVTVFDRNAPGTPLAGATVLLHDTDGSLLTELTTDAAGQAAGQGVAGGMVTVSFPDGNGARFVTIAGVGADDVLVVGPSSAGLTGVELGTMNVTLPGAVLLASAISVTSGCASNVSDMLALEPVPLLFDQGCPDPFDVLATAFDDTLHPIQYAIATDVVFMADGTIAPPVWRTDFANQTVTLTNAPAAVTTVTVVTATSSDGFLYEPVFDLVDVTGGMGEVPVKYPQGFAEAYQYGTFVDTADGGFTAVVRRSPAPPASATVDLATLLPAVTVPDVDVNGVVHFNADAALTGVDGVDLRLAWTGPGKVSGEWEVVLPGDSFSFTLPELSATLAPLGPAAGASWSGATYAFESDQIAGYAAFRAGAGAAVGAVIDVFGGGSLPATAVVRISSSTPAL
jgi:hypothetical protein